jgi:hypothetical protein
LTFNVLHGVIPQQIEFFITAAVRTSNPASEMTIWPVVLHKCELYPDVSYVKGEAYIEDVCSQSAERNNVLN